MKFIKSTFSFAAALAVGQSIALSNTSEEEERKDPREMAEEAASVIGEVADGVADVFESIIDAASGNYDGVCYKNSYVVPPQLGNTCIEGWEKVGALCY